MKRGVLWLVIAIPAASVLMGILTLYLAFNTNDGPIDTTSAPLSKTSWKASESEYGSAIEAGQTDTETP
jgi:hypothetical protein